MSWSSPPAVTMRFGRDAEWEKFAPGLKTIEDAIKIRRRVLLAFEAAERETDPDPPRALLTFVIVGGGPTGVELAGALGELARHHYVRRVPRHRSGRRYHSDRRAGSSLSAYPPDFGRGDRIAATRASPYKTNALVTEITDDYVLVRYGVE